MGEVTEERIVYKVVQCLDASEDGAPLISIYGQGSFAVTYEVGVQATPPAMYPGALLFAFDGFIAARNFAASERWSLRHTNTVLYIYEAWALVTGPVEAVGGFVAQSEEDEEALWSEFWTFVRGVPADQSWLKKLKASDVLHTRSPRGTLGCKLLELRELIGHMTASKPFTLGEYHEEDDNEP